MKHSFAESNNEVVQRLETSSLNSTYINLFRDFRNEYFRVLMQSWPDYCEKKIYVYKTTYIINKISFSIRNVYAFINICTYSRNCIYFLIKIANFQFQKEISVWNSGIKWVILVSPEGPWPKTITILTNKPWLKPPLLLTYRTVYGI